MAKKEASDPGAEKYARGVLLKSEAFAGYQRDFLAQVLKKDEYTLDEATKVVQEFFGKDVL